jgi:hypothetical protein
MNQFPPAPEYPIRTVSNFFENSRRHSPVSMTLAANFATSFASVVDTGGKFATGVNETGGKFAAGVNNAGDNLPNLPPVSMTPVANNGNNIRLLRP